MKKLTSILSVTLVSPLTANMVVRNGCLAMAIAIGGGLIPKSASAGWGEVLGAVGAVAGSIIPGVGTAVGGMVGGTIGMIVDNTQQSKSSGVSSTAGSNNAAMPATNEGELVKTSLRAWADNNKELYQQHKQMVDSILNTNERQMNQLLQMHTHQLDQMVRLNNDQRRDFLAALDRNSERFVDLIKTLDQAARESRKLDHETVMELIAGSRTEREQIYQNHKAELDRLVTEYNAKIDAAQAERDAAVNQVTDMLTSLNRQLIMAQVVHVNCSRAIDDYTFCTMIRYRNDLEKCAQKANVKSIACFE